MAVRLSRFYNDEGIGRGFQNIAGALAPPDASDQLAGQKALEIRDKGLRLADLYANTQDPQYDRRATLLGLQTGSQSLEAVGLNNATTRSTNAADNARAIQQEAMRQSGDTDRTMLAPVAQDATRFVPGRIAKMYGVPEQQYGSASLQPGEKVVRADGSELQGNAKPLGTDEVQAGAMQALTANDLRSIVMGKAPVENVQTPEGPRVQYRDRAVGSAPAATPVTPQNATNYQTPDGKQGTAVLRDGVLMDSQTGQPIPAGSKQFSTAVQGGQDATGIGSANVNKAGQQLLDLDSADAAIDMYTDMIKQTPGSLGALGAARRTFQDLIATGGEVGAVLQKQDAEIQRLVGAGKFSPDVLKRFGNFDPKLAAIPAARQRAIALQAAASSGGAQVSNRDVERIDEQLGGGSMIAGDQDALAKAAFTKSANADLRRRLGVANPTAASTFPGGPAAAPAPAATASSETWVRGPDGKLQRQQ